MQNIKKIWPVLFVLVILAAAGYGAWTMWFTKSDQASSGIDLVLGGIRPVSIEALEESRHVDVIGTPGCDVRVRYPQIVDDGAVTGEARELMNASIRALVTAFLGSGDDVGNSVTAFATGCQHDLAEFIGDETDPLLLSQAAWFSELGYDVKVNDGRYFSLGIANDLFMGGAHPSSIELFVTFDVSTGAEVRLSDFVTDDDVLRFMRDERTQLLAEHADQLFEETKVQMQEFVTSGTEEEAKALRDNLQFYVTPDAIVTFYNPYAIAPYVVGPIEVVLPRG